MKFEIEENLRGASDDEILADLRRVAEFLGKETITVAEYSSHGKCSPGTVVRRFESWNSGLEKAGLVVKIRKDISDEELFQNLEQVWIKLGRQPRYSEVRYPFSRYSHTTYDKRFGKFSNALKKFVEWINSDQAEKPQEDEVAPNPSLNMTIPVRRTRREISDRQRFRILVRDGFRCMSCGASPITQPGIELHVDHILPWSKGGETIDDNLQCKCKKCNLGKGNAFNA